MNSCLEKIAFFPHLSAGQKIFFKGSKIHSERRGFTFHCRWSAIFLTGFHFIPMVKVQTNKIKLIYKNKMKTKEETCYNSSTLAPLASIKNTKQNKTIKKEKRRTAPSIRPHTKKGRPTCSVDQRSAFTPAPVGPWNGPSLTFPRDLSLRDRNLSPGYNTRHTHHVATHVTSPRSTYSHSGSETSKLRFARLRE